MKKNGKLIAILTAMNTALGATTLGGCSDPSFDKQAQSNDIKPEVLVETPKVEPQKKSITKEELIEILKDQYYQEELTEENILDNLDVTMNPDGKIILNINGKRIEISSYLESSKEQTTSTTTTTTSKETTSTTTTTTSTTTTTTSLESTTTPILTTMSYTSTSIEADEMCFKVEEGIMLVDVKPKDTFYSYSKKYGVSIEELQELNNNELKAYSKAKVPAKLVKMNIIDDYTAQDISNYSGVSVEEICTLNNCDTKKVFKKGDIVIIKSVSLLEDSFMTSFGKTYICNGTIIVCDYMYPAGGYAGSSNHVLTLKQTGEYGNIVMYYCFNGDGTYTVKQICSNADRIEYYGEIPVVYTRDQLELNLLNAMTDNKDGLETIVYYSGNEYETNLGGQILSPIYPLYDLENQKVKVLK